MKTLINVLFICYFGYSAHALSGIIDLSSVDLHNNIVVLNGEWEFYWKQLPEPSEIDNLVVDYYPFPKSWHQGITKNGIRITSTGFATYRIKVVLPKDLPELSISLKEMNCSYILYYNGFEFAKNGKVGTHAANSQPDWLPQTINFRPYSDTIEFILQISNFSHAKGGAIHPIFMGNRELLVNQRNLNHSYNFLLCGSLIMGSLFFLGLFLFGKQEKSMLFFSLFCIVFSFRIIASGEYVLHTLFQNIPWNIIIRGEYLSLSIAPCMFILYTYSLYPKDGKKEIMIGFTIISVLGSLLILLTPSIFFTQLVEPYLVIVILVIFYLVYAYWKSFQNKRTGSQYTLIGTLIVFVVVCYQILIYFTHLEENTLFSFLGFLLFFFVQSLSLSYRFAHSMTQAKEAAESASKSKTDFLSTISHEIRTPLNAVVGISQFLISDNPKPQQIESLESLQFSAKNLTSLINDILDYNKLESGSIEFEYTEINLHELTNNIIKVHNAFAKEKQLQLILKYDPAISNMVLSDSVRISQVLNNLLINALKFTKKGHVILSLTQVSEESDVQTILFEIEDTGIGIPEDKLELIFDRFTQAGSSTAREFGGTGLGLAIIKSILLIWGSKIEVKSKLNGGSTFTFELVMQKSAGITKSQVVRLPEIHDAMLKDKKVLLVEDNQMNILVAKKFLARWEMKTDVALNGKFGLEKFKENDYDIVLMDLQMPEMDGYEATKQIRKLNKTIPIIALTASALLKIQQDVQKVGMNDYITKPFNPIDLKSKIAFHLEKNKDN